MYLTVGQGSGRIYELSVLRVDTQRSAETATVHIHGTATTDFDVWNRSDKYVVVCAGDQTNVLGDDAAVRHGRDLK